MRYRFTLLCFLMLPGLFANAQPSAKKNSGKGKKTISRAPVHHRPGTALKGKSAATSSPASSLSKKTETTQTATSGTNVTGIWKGYFVQNALSFFDDKYRFEVQVAEQDNHGLTAVTYSYKTTVFYGKAEATGIYTAKSKNFLLKELKLTDIKLTDENTGACLMTCYLDYDKIGSNESLSGTYTSVSLKDKSDCGNGKVYLEKSPVTDFYKEDFLVKRENELKNREKPAIKKAVSKKPASNSVAKVNQPKATVKPGAEQNIIAKQKTVKPQPETVAAPKTADPLKPTPPPLVAKSFPKPEVLKTRDNALLKTIVTSEKEFKIELYDNGEIDGDRISVYHNNELIVSNKTLSDKPITFTIKADENVPVHDFVMVAENMGTIPPNTSLMIITAGSQRYELFVTSTDQKNAVVRVEYKADNGSNK